MSIQTSIEFGALDDEPPIAPPRAEPVAPPRAEPPRPSSRGRASSRAGAPLETLELETRLLTRAQARRERDPAAGLDALAEHRARFPDGALAEARELLELELRCSLGQVDRARARAQRLARAGASAPLIARALKTCPDGH